ncbi:MAG: dihydroorotase [Thermoleophilia bacterium]|nr:dihydroorotase [Thermoleophilia bacterium]
MTTIIAKRGTKATLVIRDARVFDPGSGIDTRTDVLIEKGQIVRIAPGKGSVGEAQVIDGAGRLLLPGFVDLHAHLRSPGREDEEDMASGTRAAAAGGYVTICAMPNTDPVVDNAAVIASLAELAEADAMVRVAFLGAISRGEKGDHLSDMWDMAGAGAVGFTDDGRPVADAGLLRAAFQAARNVNLPLSLHCEDLDLAGAGVVNEGTVSAQLGLAGIPGTAESSDVARNLDIALYEGARVHIAHVSCARSVAAVDLARKAGGAVTCEVTPHHLALNDEEVRGLDANFKMNPPLRNEADRLALVEALASGVIDCIATDHAPHATQEKETPFEEAPFGVIGLETAFAVLYSELVQAGAVSLEVLVQAMSSNPARAFGLPVPTITEGQEANLCLVDVDEEYEIDPAGFYSKSRNSAFSGRKVRGRVLLTLVAGRMAHNIL